MPALLTPAHGPNGRKAGHRPAFPILRLRGDQAAAGSMPGRAGGRTPIMWQTAKTRSALFIV